MGSVFYKHLHSTQYLPSTGLGFLQILTSLIFIIILENVYDYYPHFADKGTEKFSDLHKATQVVSVTSCNLAPDCLLWPVSQRMQSLS